MNKEILANTKILNQRSGEPQAFHLIRTLGMKAFEELGWPNKKLEAWKYSPTRRLTEAYEPELFQSIAAEGGIQSIIDLAQEHDLHPVIIRNQKIAHWPTELDGKVTVLTLREALERGLIDSALFHNASNNSLEALNMSYFDVGFYLKLEDHCTLNKPILWTHVLDSERKSPLFNGRFVIECGPGSSCTFIESIQFSGESETAWVNYSTHAKLNSKAHLHFVQLNEIMPSEQHTGRFYADLEDETFLHHLNASLSAGWHRNEINVTCRGAQSEVLVHGIGYAVKEGTTDQQTYLEFRSPGNKAEQIYKNLLNDSARTIFNGKIHIAQDAQKTDCSQLHQSILLSRQAEVDTKPELEIYADDVKATHGATVGQLNEDEIFYFQSRGISRSRARTLLCLAFLMELCEKVPHQSAENFLKRKIENFWKREWL